MEILMDLVRKVKHRRIYARRLSHFVRWLRMRIARVPPAYELPLSDWRTFVHVVCSMSDMTS